MKTISLATSLVAAAALAPTAGAATAPPKLIGTPALTYTITGNADNGHFVSVGASVRLSRAFADTAELHRYAVVAAPRLHAGQKLPDELFGGSSLGRLSNRQGAWYRAEAAQLKQRRSVRRGARWQVALARGNRIVGAVKTVILKRA